MLPNPSDFNKATLHIEETDETIDKYAKSIKSSQELRQRISQADALIIPSHKFGHFPNQTAELFAFLKEVAPDNISIEIAAGEDEQDELMLHADWLLIAGIIVSDILAPLVVNLIWNYIESRRGRRIDQTEIHTELVVIDSNTGEAKRLSYIGPASEYRNTVLTALNSKLELLEETTNDDYDEVE